jgi:hypothetical protein
MNQITLRGKMEERSWRRPSIFTLIGLLGLALAWASLALAGLTLVDPAARQIGLTLLDLLWRLIPWPVWAGAVAAVIIWPLTLRYLWGRP